ncbi:MAG: hypothetical protein J6B24_04390 [Clostridia bacterium]|nr:hypothetical protein [Clostridia bacterium]
MTVKEAVKVLHTAKIQISFGEQIFPLDTKDQLLLNAFGDFVIYRISALDSNVVDLEIAIAPLKEHHHE